MKRVLVVLLSLMLMCLVGCSSKTNIVVTGYEIQVNGQTVMLNEWTETEATYRDEEHSVTYFLCDGINSCEHRPSKFFAEDLVAYEKAKYYSDNFDTQVRMYYESKASTREVFSLGSRTATTPLTSRLIELYSTLSVIPLGEEFNLSFQNKVSVNVFGVAYRIRPNEIVIPSMIRVELDDGSLEAVTQQTIGEVVVGKVSTPNYDYYLYDGVRVQAEIGLDISSYITFLQGD